MGDPTRLVLTWYEYMCDWKGIWEMADGDRLFLSAATSLRVFRKPVSTVLLWISILGTGTQWDCLYRLMRVRLNPLNSFSV